MKISYNWLKDYLDIDLPWQKVSEILTDIGLEVEGEEQTESIPGGLAGLVVGEVTFKDQHPNADRLSITRVDVGGEQELHIVCGAPNVAQGQKVIVATVGTTLHPIEGEPFKIKKGKIRGEVSEGMICAEDEIGVGSSHDGIIVLAEDTKVGTAASEIYSVEKDTLFEIGLTPNRSDATAHLGVAQDLAAALAINHGYTKGVKMPDVSAFQVQHHTLPITVEVEDTEACPRYAGLSIQGVEVKPSPEWLQKKLRSIGATPKNNIVDITNFILHELGQPLHAFDADKIRGQKVMVKKLAAGTTFTTLDEVERTLDADDLMICNGKSEGMCIAGVFGGLHSGVTESTKNIFLESAHFQPTHIRRTSHRHQLRTDAAKCYEKGSDPNICIYALQRAALLIQELAGGEIASDIIDVYPKVIEPAEVVVRFDYVNRLIGDDIPKEKVEAILTALSIDIIEKNEDSLRVAIPTNKVDVVREADVIEEILRIYGLNQVSIPTQIKASLSYSLAVDPFQVRNRAANLLAAHGFLEMMAVSITESKYFKELYPVKDEELVYINNTSNMHLDVMRPVMLFSGLEAVLHNQNRRASDLRLFEFGHTYRYHDGEYVEREHLTLFLTGQRHPESWLNKDKEAVSFYSLKAYVEQVMQRLGIAGFQTSKAEEQQDALAYGLRFHRGPNTLVEMGQVKGRITQALGIKQPVFYADFDWGQIMKALKNHKIEYQALNKYPTVRRDLALVLDTSVPFSTVEGGIRKVGKKLLQSVNLFDVFKDEEKLGAGKKSYAISLIFEDPKKTLKDKEVDKVMKKVIQQLEQKVGAVVRQ